MKKYNIKTLKYIIFTFVCMISCIFMCGKVSASALTCDYDIIGDDGTLLLNDAIRGGLNDTSAYKNSTIRLSYFENGSVELGFYDKKSGKFYDSIRKDHASKFHDAGLYINHLSAKDIKKQYDFKNGCPQQLYSVIMTEGEENNPDIYTSDYGDISSWSNQQYALYLGTKQDAFPLKTLADMGDSCGERNHNATQNSNYCPAFGLSKVADGSGNASKPQKAQNANAEDFEYYGTLCEYGDGQYLNEDGRDLTVYIMFSFDDKYVYNLNGVIPEQNRKFNNVAYNFTASQLGGSCPKLLFAEANENNSGQSGTHFLSIEKEPGKSYYEFGLIKKLQKGEIKEDKTVNVCDNGAMKIVSKAYNVLRFLIPVLIIVLSVIDFASVVVSGKEDTMAKAKKNFITRLVVGMIILFLPFILEMILRISGILGSGENLVDATCNIMK